MVGFGVCVSLILDTIIASANDSRKRVFTLIQNGIEVSSLQTMKLKCAYRKNTLLRTFECTRSSAYKNMVYTVKRKFSLRTFL
jgi:hypothetical protein